MNAVHVYVYICSHLVEEAMYLGTRRGFPLNTFRRPCLQCIFPNYIHSGGTACNASSPIAYIQAALLAMHLSQLHTFRRPCLQCILPNSIHSGGTACNASFPIACIQGGPACNASSQIACIQAALNVLHQRCFKVTLLSRQLWRRPQNHYHSNIMREIMLWLQCRHVR